MKVLHICQRDDLATGGAARVAIELTRVLPPFGIDAHCLFVYGKPGAFSAELPDRTRHLGLTSSRKGLKGLGALRRMVVEENFDVVHHHDGLIWTHLATRSTGGIRRVGHAHLSPPDQGGTLRNRFSHGLQIGTYDRLVAVSTDTQADWIASGFPERQSIVIPNGVDLNRFHPARPEVRHAVRSNWGLREMDKAVGFVGRLDSEMKGCREFVDLIAALPGSFFGVMAGDGPDRSNLETYARDSGVASRLRFLGMVDPALLVYPGLDVFVMTSRYEPFGLVLLEAAASGVPIAMIPGSGGSMKLADRLGAWILPDRSSECFAAAVESLASKETARGRQVGKEVLKTFSWERAADSLSKLYLELFAPSSESFSPP
ncbi:MAG: glycosyltransferase family 4 protein [Verrucomicrobiae bacterium]|nr:glycosyltransferase family 4 protein [Verrucomicrobiae bacterium]